MNVEQFKHPISVLILEWLKYEDKETNTVHNYRADTSQILKKVHDYLLTLRICSAWYLS